MPRQYLDVPYRSKDAAKALGARFDGEAKRWYVDEGVELSDFSAWLPAGLTLPPITQMTGSDLATPKSELSTVRRGVSLSRLLSGVSAAVAKAFAEGVWTLVEVNDVNLRGGHVYLELSERDANGQTVAKARAMIWAGTATRILPEFERATGAVIGAGIKLLVRARPAFKAQYGFSLEIDAIDPDYTLGDLEAKKREIRMRLQSEGLFERNRLLSLPFDFQLVLVVSPAEAAGLGDFRKEADRMGRHGVCRFVYAHSRFQGEGAAQEIVATATQALRDLGDIVIPDAIVLIRGGGAVNDLAWLNDYALARWVCDQPIPVLTGIGHERDSTVIDEVANTRFDTPSKVVSGIEQQIVARARETQRAWDLVASAAQRSLQAVRMDVASMEAQIRGDARGHIAEARQVSAGVVHEIAVGSVRRVHDRAGQTAAMMTEIREGTNRDIAAARQAVPAMLASIRSDALSNLQEARTGVGTDRSEILARAAEGVRTASVASRTRMHDVAERAVNSVRTAREGAQALIREVAGQGPQKTLGRGFAIVRNVEGSAITSADTARDSAELNIEFRDGRVIALPDSDQKRRTS